METKIIIDRKEKDINVKVKMSFLEIVELREVLRDYRQTTLFAALRSNLKATCNNFLDCLESTSVK